MGDTAAVYDAAVRRGREEATAEGSVVVTGLLGGMCGVGGDRGMELKVVVLVVATNLRLLLLFPTPRTHSSFG